MSLRIDEDKMGPASRGNNSWGHAPLLMGRVPARTASDGRFPSLPPSRLRPRSTAEMRKGRMIMVV